MCGDMEMSVCWLIENHDIVVMTAQILVNALQSGEVPSLGIAVAHLIRRVSQHDRKTPPTTTS